MPEYSEAFQDDRFWNSVCMYFQDASPDDCVDRRKELLEQKFTLAGHSARFMFNQDNATTITELRETAKAIEGIDALHHASRSAHNQGAMNLFIARFQNEKQGPTPEQSAELPTVDDLLGVATNEQELLRQKEEADSLDSSASLVSAYATKKVIAKILHSTVEKLRLVGKTLNNQAIIEYAFEELLKKKLKKAKQLGQKLATTNTSGSTFLDVSDVKICDDSAQVEALLKARQAANTWIFVAGRQGAFDAVHIVSNTHIRFVQITAGKSHSLKLNVLDSLLTSIMHEVTWSHLEFPEDDDREFALSPPLGAIPVLEYKRFDNQPWHRADHRDNVQYGKLDWY